MSLLDQASLVLVPSAYKTGEVLVQKPLPTKFSDETGNYDGNDPQGSANLTFTRNSNATRVNADGLVEKVRQNLLTYSEAFDNAVWNKVQGGGVTVSANAETAPDGTNSADKVIETVTSGAHIIYQDVVVTSGTTYTQTYFVKAAERTKAYILIQGSLGSGSAIFDTSNGTFLSASGATYSALQFSNNWWRISIVKQAAGTGAAAVKIGTVDASGSTSYAGDGTSGVYVWGAQLEISDFGPTQYIPTTSAAVSVGATPNTPRLNYSNGCPSLLLEPQRTNLTTYSEAFGDTNWNKRSGLIVTSNYSTSPDGYQNADRVQKGTSLDGYIYKLYTFSASTTHTFSVYAKGTGTFGFNFYDGTSAHISDTYTLTSSWQRFTYTFTTNSTTAGGDYGIKVNNDAELWGAQLEAGSYATSYIPTLGASVTRLADSCWKTISAMSGSGYTSTLYVEIDGRFNPGPIDQIRWYPSADIAARFWIYTNVMGSAAAPIGESFPVDNPKHKFIFKAESSTSISIFYNGVKKTFYTSATTGNGYDTLEIYGQNANEGYNVSQILAFPTALTDAQCIELTTL